MYPIEYIYKTINYYYVNKFSFNKISKILNISRQIISIWIKKFKEDINFISIRNKIKNVTFNKKINNLDIQLFVKDLIYKNPFITRNEVIEYIYLQYKIKLTINNISKLYKILKMTRKKPKYHIIKNQKFMDELIEKRSLYNREIKNKNINKIISIDESGFNKLFSIHKGISEKGTKINIPIKQKLDKNISLLLAVTTNGILNFQIKKENINSILFYNFIKETINKLTEKNYIFLFDNICFHHNKQMLELIKSSGHNYIFTPPYSPNNNPVESIFSIIKNKYSKIKYKIENKTKVEKQIFDIINEVTIEFNNFNNIFIRSLNFNYSNIEKELRDRIIFIL
jgi:transposase